MTKLMHTMSKKYRNGIPRWCEKYSGRGFQAEGFNIMQIHSQNIQASRP